MTEDEHPHLEAVADYSAGLLDGEQADAVGSHVAACHHCQARADELADVSRILAAAPTPQLPPGVAARIDEALAGASAGVRRDTVGVSPSPHRKFRSLWLSSAAACLVVMLVGGLFGVRSLSDGPVNSGSGGTAPLSREGSLASREGRPHAAEPRMDRGDTDQAGTSVTASGRDYSSRELPRQVSHLLRDETPGGAARVQAARPTPSPLRRLAAPSALARCVSRVTGSNDDPLAVDLASFSGRPSAIIVTSEGLPEARDVWVVDPSCSRVRLHTELPRHGD